MANAPFNITIVGAGNSGHVCAALFPWNCRHSQDKVNVRLLTTRPGDWNSRVSTVELPSGQMIEGKVDVISNDCDALLRVCDLLLWTGPVHCVLDFFRTNKDYIDTNKTIICLIFCQGIVHVGLRELLGPCIKLVALRNIPWLCRITKRGNSSQIVGVKNFIAYASMSVPKEFVFLRIATLFGVPNKAGELEPHFTKLRDFAPIIFNPANQIIHSAIYFGIFRRFSVENLPFIKDVSKYLYREVDEFTGQILTELDSELRTIYGKFLEFIGTARFMNSDETQNPNVDIVDEIPHAMESLQRRLEKQYKSQITDKTTVAKMISTNASYKEALTPFIRRGEFAYPAVNHRIILDDINFGLCVLVSIGRIVRAPTPTMDFLILWYQKWMGKIFMTSSFALDGKDSNELIIVRDENDLKNII